MYRFSRHKPAASSAEEEAATVDIPDDLVLHMLHKLPVKSLLRFRSVSKQWKETITSSVFEKKHINYVTQGIATTSANISTLIYSYSQSGNVNRFHASRICTGAPPKTYKIKDDRFKEINHPQYFLRKPLVLLTSCNGLLCMARDPYYDLLPVTHTCMQVCNPAIGKYRDVPKLPVEFDETYGDNTMILGFGYDPIIDDYKIVYSFITTVPRTWIVLVMSLKSNAWRLVDTSPIPDQSFIQVVRPMDNNTQAACSGELYWIVLFTTKIFDTDGISIINNVMILKFNLADEAFELVPFPEEESSVSTDDTLCRRLRSTLSTHKGSLYIFVPRHSQSFMKDITSPGLDIWMLERSVDGITNDRIWHNVGFIPTYKGMMSDSLGFNCSGHVIMKVRPDPYRRSLLSIYAYLLNEKKYVEICKTKIDSCVHLVQMESLATP